MSNSLQVTQTLTQEGNWLITASIVEGSALPSAVFIYENNGTTELGRYVGVCNASELSRLKEFTGTAIKVFANKNVRYSTAKITVDNTASITSVVANMESNLKSLIAEVAAIGNSTQIITLS